MTHDSHQSLQSEEMWYIKQNLRQTNTFSYKVNEEGAFEIKWHLLILALPSSGMLRAVRRRVLGKYAL